MSTATAVFGALWWLFRTRFDLDNQSAIGVATVGVGFVLTSLGWWAGNPRNAAHRNDPPAATAKTDDDAPAAWNVPARNSHFTGRARELDRLAALGRAATHSLTGIGGVGKTQLALEHVWRHAAHYRIACWIAAQTPDTVESQLADLALDLGLVPQTATTAVGVRRLRDFLSRTAGWILVFDNAESTGPIWPLIPDGPGEVIITSRHGDFVQLTPTLTLELMARRDSIALIRKALPDLPVESADALADALGDLPLALTQAVGYLTQTGVSLPEYLRLLASRPAFALEAGPTGAYPRSLNAAISLTLDQLATRHPAALRLLRVLALLAPEPIPSSWLVEAAATSKADEVASAKTGEALLPDGAGETARALAVLVNYGILGVAGNTVQLHRLTGAVVADSVPPSAHDSYRCASHALLAAAVRTDASDPNGWGAYRALRPHVEVAEPFTSVHPVAWRLVYRFTEFLFYSGDLNGCLAFARAATEQGRRVLGEEHPDWLRVAKFLGYILIIDGQVAEARELTKRIAQLSSATCGSESRDTLDAQSLLAGSLRAAGEFEQACRIEEDVVATARRVLGEDDPTTLALRHNLGVALRNVGRFEEALRLNLDTYRRRVVAIGTSHAETLRTRSCVSISQRESGDYTGAVRHQEQTYRQHVRVFGDQHPESILAARHLAVCMRRAGDYAGALRVSRAAVERSRLVYGEDHPQSIYIAVAHAADLRFAGSPHAAYELTAALLKQYTRRYGAAHPNTHCLRSNLGAILRGRGDVGSALRYATAAYDGLAESPGEHHPYTLLAAVELANAYNAAGDLRAAREFGATVHDGLTRRLGTGHPVVLGFAANVALDAYHCRERPTLDEHRMAVHAFASAVGVKHPMVSSLGGRERFSQDIEIFPW
ncbi:tetratricopeptide repeat protein [Plantactinospora sp. S1510]|uniref:Tetratricopeptide repeat protein n=1 Tax=Plantactinospora alkalitolerans TaxID=2789879 RepID=A0ABS0GPA1_9ACTN|nr:FxSxx-COOH system tetratricopeptide repeat protein [Plantactinospora alkalitolerans]MBF9128005.1 tetratricopeptide repeat protein [Plantactinospora alkalitolerans]